MRKSTSGKLQGFDQGDRSVTLEGGQMFHVGPSVDLTSIRPGDFVVIEYDENPRQTGLGPAPALNTPERAAWDSANPNAYDRIADVVAKSSPDHPDHRNPNIPLRTTPQQGVNPNIPPRPGGTEPQPDHS